MLPFNFLIFCNRMDVQKAQMIPLLPFTLFGTMRLFKIINFVFFVSFLILSLKGPLRFFLIFCNKMDVKNLKCPPLVQKSTNLPKLNQRKRSMMKQYGTVLHVNWICFKGNMLKVSACLISASKFTVVNIPHTVSEKIRGRSNSQYDNKSGRVASKKVFDDRLEDLRRLRALRDRKPF